MALRMKYWIMISVMSKSVMTPSRMGLTAIIAGFAIEILSETGTAEAGGDNVNSLFIGFAPYDEPTLVISVCVEGNGANVEGQAAAIAGQVLEDSLQIQASGAAK